MRVRHQCCSSLRSSQVQLSRCSHQVGCTKNHYIQKTLGSVATHFCRAHEVERQARTHHKPHPTKLLCSRATQFVWNKCVPLPRQGALFYVRQERTTQWPHCNGGKHHDAERAQVRCREAVGAHMSDGVLPTQLPLLSVRHNWRRAFCWLLSSPVTCSLMSRAA